MQDIQETQFQSLGQEDSPRVGMATHSTILVWESHGQRGTYTPWGYKELDRIEHVCMHTYLYAYLLWFIIGNICYCSVTPLCPTLCNAMDCSTPGLPVPHHNLEFAQVDVYWISDATQPSHPLMPSSPSALNVSQHQGLFQWVVWSFSFSISPSSEYSGLISLKNDWFDLLSVQGTFRSLESSPEPQFEDIDSLASCLLYGTDFTIVCDHWEDLSLDSLDVCWPSNVSAF